MSKCDFCGYLNDNIDGKGKRCMFDQKLGTTMCDYYLHYMMNNWEECEKELKEMGDAQEEEKEKSKET